MGHISEARQTNRNDQAYSMLHRDEYYQWPFLTNDEFELACAYFHKKYVGAELGRRRRTFKIYHQRDLTEGTSYIEIRRLLVIDQDADDLSRDLEKLRADDWAHQCSDMGVDTSLEDADEVGGLNILRRVGVRAGTDLSQEALHSKRSQVLLPQYKPRSHGPYVTYEIHLHPTYRMPTLWFTLHDLPMSEPAFDLDSVYRYLVPDEYKNRLREIGPLGGISAAVSPRPFLVYVHIITRTSIAPSADRPSCLFHSSLPEQGSNGGL